MTDMSIALEAVKAEIAELEQALKDKKARLRELRPTKSKAEPRECQCGCGGMTGGGLFLPGHDAKMRSRLLTAIRAGGPDGEAALDKLLNDFPTLLHGADPQAVRDQLGSELRKADAAVEREAQAHAKRDEKG